MLFSFPATTCNKLNEEILGKVLISADGGAKVDLALTNLGPAV